MNYKYNSFVREKKKENEIFLYIYTLGFKY